MICVCVLAPVTGTRTEPVPEPRYNQPGAVGAGGGGGGGGGGGEITIGSIRLQVVPGDITKENTDAIVNGTNPQLDLTQGTYIPHLLFYPPKLNKKFEVFHFNMDVPKQPIRFQYCHVWLADQRLGVFYWLTKALLGLVSSMSK